jgi:hypothetical protein
VLPGDVNGDGVVNSKDFTILRGELKGKKPATIFGELLGAGIVTAGDLQAAESSRGAKLPKLNEKPAKTRLARKLVTQPAALKPHL